MFGKLMNNYYYGKSGKGDYRKEDLPKNRWQLFWEMLKIRFSALLRLNLMYMVVWIPAIVVVLMGALSALTTLTNAVDAAATADLAASVQSDLSGILLSTLLLLAPCIAITGPCTAGMCYVTRNWARDEHAFIWTDFKDALKENWKQSLVISVITGVMPLLVYVCWNFYGAYAQTSGFMIVPQILIAMVGMLWALAVTYFHPLIVTYKLKLRDVFRNGFLLAVARLPQSVGIRLLHCVPMVLGVVLIYFLNPIWVVLGMVAYYALIGFGLSRFVTASYTNAVFDRFINARMEGVEVNRGMAKEEDLDDEDEDDAGDGAQK